MHTVGSRIRRSARTPDTKPPPIDTAPRIRRSNEAIRRQTLTAAALDTAWGLKVTKTAGPDPVDATRPIVEQKDLAGGTEAKIYADTTALGTASDKAAALGAAATRAGEVGAKMQAWALANWATIRNTKLAKGDTHSNKNIFNLGKPGEEKKLDPWVHKVVVPYTNKAGAQTLTLEFQHTKGFDGYLSKVADTGNEDLNKTRPGRPRANSIGAAMYMGKKKPISASAPVIGNIADFSNLHDGLDGESGTKNLLEVSGGKGHVAADAYTKLAGEGARFMCVRDNIAKVRNDTRFYYEHEGKNYGITFTNLWVSWADHFDKAYNIPNDTIVAKLKATASLRTEVTDVDVKKDVKLV